MRYTASTEEATQLIKWLCIFSREKVMKRHTAPMIFSGEL